MWDWLLRFWAAKFRRCIPGYQPAIWNDANGVQFNNNCYNYARNMITATYAQPGRGSGNMYTTVDCAEVGKGAVSDGLVVADCNSGCGGVKCCCHQVALVIAPGPDFIDFHWYRRDRNGFWSHKPGGGQATNVDGNGNLITDPRTADRGPYTVFCGCYCVCKADPVYIN